MDSILNIIWLFGLLAFAFYIVYTVVQWLRNLNKTKILWLCGIAIVIYLGCNLAYFKFEEWDADIIARKTQAVKTKFKGLDCSMLKEVNDPSTTEDDLHDIRRCKQMKAEFNATKVEYIDINRELADFTADTVYAIARYAAGLPDALGPIDDAFAWIGYHIFGYNIKVLACWITRVCLFIMFCVARRMWRWAEGSSVPVHRGATVDEIMNALDKKGVFPKQPPSWLEKNVPRLMQAQNGMDILLASGEYIRTDPVVLHEIQQQRLGTRQVEQLAIQARPPPRTQVPLLAAPQQERAIQARPLPRTDVALSASPLGSSQ